MTTKPRYEDFAFQSKTISGSEIDTSDVRRAIDFRKQQYVSTDDEAQRLAVFTTTPSELTSPEYVVRATAFSDDNGRPEGAVFDAILAEATGRRVIAVNAPGVDYWTPTSIMSENKELTGEQLGQLRRGRFQAVGEASMRAVVMAAHSQGETDPEFIVSASSMGVAIAAGMLRGAVEDNISIRGVVLAEPVNHVKRPLARLGSQFVGANATATGYLKQNPDILNDSGESQLFWAKRLLADRMANLAYARALSKGTFFADLGESPLEMMADRKTPLYVTRGSASKLSSGDFDSAFSQNDNVKSKVFEYHDHPYTMTIQSVIDGVKEVVEL